MTQFNPDNKEKLTYGESLGPAMDITDPEDAKQYFKSYTEWLQSKIGTTYTDAEEIAKRNISYYTGYYNNETQKRVLNLFNLV